MLKKERPQQGKEEDLQETHHGSVGQDSPIEHLGGEAETTKTEEVVEEEEVEEEETYHLLPEEIQNSKTTEQS